MSHLSVYEVALAAVVAISYLLAVFQVLINLFYRKTFYKWSVMTSLVVGVCSLCLLYWNYTPPLDHDDVPQLKAMGNQLIQQIENYKSLNGSYPSSLKEAHIESPRTRYGSWRYFLSEQQDSFVLVLGNFYENTFTLQWKSDRKVWDWEFKNLEDSWTDSTENSLMNTI